LVVVPFKSLPLLYVDVDGVVSLFGFDHATPPTVCPVSVDGIPHWLSADAGACLRRLSRTFECVWCTGWEERAEEHLPHFLDLPGGWEHLRFGEPPADWWHGHWKLGAIEAHAGPQRPLAWVDDALDERCEEWAASRPGPTLLVKTDPAVGLVDEHVTRLEAWASANTGH
jgi:hypothetical protein